MKPTPLQHLLSAGITFLLATLGFWLMSTDYVGYGYTLFICTPIAIGIALGDNGSWRTGAIYAGVLGLLAFMMLLILSGTEGLVCILFLTPIVVPVMIGGIIIGKGIHQWLFPKDNSKIRAIVLPVLIILLSAGIEHSVTTEDYRDIVTSMITVPYPTDEVFYALEKIDTLDAEKSMLLMLGLPVPEKCVLDSAVTGSFRTCYFRDGYIRQQMTEYVPGEILKMKVIENTLPGRPWITFEDAFYEFKEVPEGTQIIRHTSYYSTLQPRIYWQWAEHLGVKTEHEYVFRDLERRLSKKVTSP